MSERPPGRRPAVPELAVEQEPTAIFAPLTRVTGPTTCQGI